MKSYVVTDFISEKCLLKKIPVYKQ